MIVGVGGQGTLLTSRILGGITLDAGYDVKLARLLKSAAAAFSSFFSVPLFSPFGL